MSDAPAQGPNAAILAPPLTIWTDARMREHDPSHAVRAAHPERPARWDAVRSAIDRFSADPRVAVRSPAPATADAVLRAHTRAHVEGLAALTGRVARLDPDTSVSATSIEAAWLAAGAVVEGVDALLSGGSRRAWALVRPPGHHALADKAMGFCLVNNLAVGVMRALDAGLTRVLVVDFDVHAGNGTAEIFAQDPRVLVCDLHQAHHFPFSGDFHEIGRGPGEGYTLNLPLPAGCDGRAYLRAFEQWLLPIADAFRPQLVVIAAGFDAHAADPLGDMQLVDRDYARMVHALATLADRHAEGRMLLTLEGGYDLDALSRSVGACIGALTDRPPPQAADGGAGAPVLAAPDAGLLGTDDVVPPSCARDDSGDADEVRRLADRAIDRAIAVARAVGW